MNLLEIEIVKLRRNCKEIEGECEKEKERHKNTEFEMVKR